MRNEYLAAENEILRSRLGTRVALTQSERVRLAKIGKKRGKRALHGVSTIVKPETILGWYRRLVAQKFDGSKNRKKRGRPRVDVAVERLVLEMAEANASWGYDRIVGALRNLGYNISTDRRNKRVGHCGGRISPFSPRRRASLPRPSSPYREHQIRSRYLPSTPRGRALTIRFSTACCANDQGVFQAASTKGRLDSRWYRTVVRLRWSRILSMTSARSTTSRTRRRPPQAGQVERSSS